MGEVSPVRCVRTTTQETIAEHVIDRYGQVWRLVRDGGMAVRADALGIISIGISTLEHQCGPLFNLNEYQSAPIEEIDRNARAYGWEAHKAGRLVAQGTTSDGNPFLDPRWRDHIEEPEGSRP